MLKDKLQICIITYNRKKYIQRTLDQLLAENSPIRDYDIIVLDNASTDGTSELIEEYCKSFPNLKHIRHAVNIGGNANVIRAFEIGKASGKEYFWGLCDDDKYDFSNWAEVEKNVNEGKDIICVSNYAIQYAPDKEISLSDKLIQLTFFPAGIYRTDLLDSNVIINMTYSIADMFPHLCAVIHAVNQNKKIVILDKPIVFNGLHCKLSCKDYTYTRGADKNYEITKQMQHSSWYLGYANTLNLVHDKNLRKSLFLSAMQHHEVCGNWEKFYCFMYTRYFEKGLYNYMYEVFSLLPFKYTIGFFMNLLRMKISLNKVNFINKQDWAEYFERKDLQKTINKLSEKLKNKKVLLYGDGIVSRVIQERYDLSKLNIVAITDKKFMGCDYDETKYKPVSPSKLNLVDFDTVLIALKDSKTIKNYFNDNKIKKEIIELVK